GLGTSDDGDETPAIPTAQLAEARTPSPTLTPTVPAATPTPEAPPNREDCDETRGTDYLSPEERLWILDNCIGTGNASAGGGGGGAPTGGGSIYANEYALGAQLIIPAIGVNAVVTGADVGPSGQMPDPVGYWNAVQYNFPYHPGLGGSNKVLAAHVDCAR